MVNLKENNRKNKKLDTTTYLVALYNGHHGHEQHNNNVKIARAIKMAKQMSNQNNTRFSAL